MKRFLSTILAVVFCFSLGVGAFAAGTAEDGQYVSSAGWVFITIDPGHGGADTGAIATYNGRQYAERDLVMKIALYLKEELETYRNVSVAMTRTSNAASACTQVGTIEPRVDFAKDHGADLLVSLHLNAHNSTAVHGAWALTSNGNYNQGVAAVGTAVGDNILNELSKLGVTRQGHLIRNSSDSRYPNGTVADYYGIVRYGILKSVPSLIVEHCFLTNQSDFSQFLSTDEKLRQLALADAAGIVDYFGLEKKDGTELSNAIVLTDYRDHWGASYIDRAIQAGWVKGYPDRTFRPDVTLSRADFVTLLARLSGEDLTPFGGSSFPDVSADSYFAQSVAWAVNAGIISGFPDGTFRPGEAITRAQMAHIMALYLKHKGFDTTYTGDGTDSRIADIGTIGAWALDDVLFCYGAGLLNGRGANFEPDGIATRAEACTVLTRLYDYETTNVPASPQAAEVAEDASVEPAEAISPEPASEIPEPESAASVPDGDDPIIEPDAIIPDEAQTTAGNLVE